MLEEYRLKYSNCAQELTNDSVDNIFSLYLDAINTKDNFMIDKCVSAFICKYWGYMYVWRRSYSWSHSLHAEDYLEFLASAVCVAIRQCLKMYNRDNQRFKKEKGAEKAFNIILSQTNRRIFINQSCLNRNLNSFLYNLSDEPLPSEDINYNLIDLEQNYKNIILTQDVTEYLANRGCLTELLVVDAVCYQNINTKDYALKNRIANLLTNKNQIYFNHLINAYYLDENDLKSYLTFYNKLKDIEKLNLIKKAFINIKKIMKSFKIGWN